MSDDFWLFMAIVYAPIVAGLTIAHVGAAIGEMRDMLRRRGRP